MRSQITTAAIASLFIGFATQGLAQSSSGSAADSAKQSTSGRTFTHGESKRCESLTGADKDQCDKEEATKTQGPAARDSRTEQNPAGSSAAGSSSPTFTHGESKRCGSLTGADKDQCDKEEGSKTEGAAAREASK